jgi:tetratricopeptide (TPR) repeat protein
MRERVQAMSGARSKSTTAEVFPEWVTLRQLLLLVRDIRAADRDDALELRRSKLRELADASYFASFRPDKNDQARATEIVIRILRAVNAESREVPRVAYTPAGRLDDKAVLLWFAMINQGLTPDALSRMLRALFTETKSDTAQDIQKRTGLIRRVMWHPGDHPRLASRPGIERIVQAVRYALESPDDELSLFELEWDRLTAHKDQLQLLSFLAFMAPEALSMEWVLEGAHVLPSPLRRTIVDAEARNALLSVLVNRTLVRRPRATVIVLPKRVRQEIRRRTSTRERRLILDRGLRFLTEVLPPDTHHFAAWPTWQALLAHLDATLAQAAEFPALRMRCAHLLDRRSVFFRNSAQNYSRAIADSRSAVALAEAAGVPDAGEYAIFLGNLAMAEDFSGDPESALSHFDQALEVTRRNLGAEHEDYAETLNLKANALSQAGKVNAARRSYAKAERIIRRVHAKDSRPFITQVFREILNDYAAFLLNSDPTVRRAGDVKLAVKMLREAAAMMDEADAGWFQVHSNLAQVAQAEGRWQDFHDDLQPLLKFSRTHFGPRSLQTYAVLRDLADACRALGRNREAIEYDQLAHEVDDDLAAADDVEEGDDDEDRPESA